MDSPFFRSYWNAPSLPRHKAYSPSMRGIPVRRQTTPTPSPTVVSIPVQFVNSERSRSEESAVKIQKAFRGFLARKSVRRIEAIRLEVEEMEKRISKKETVDLIRRDSKEQLKVNEVLMNFLFRLDSVRAVDSRVRVFRKAVIKKVVALQETVDSIVAGEVENNDVVAELLDENQEIKEFDACLGHGEDVVDQTLDLQQVEDSESNFADNCNSFTNAVDQSLENTDIVAEVLDHNQEIEELPVCLERSEEVGDQNLELQGKPPNVEDSVSNFSDNCNSFRNTIDQSLESNSSEFIANSVQVQDKEVELSRVEEISEMNTNERQEVVEDNNASQSNSYENPQSLTGRGEDYMGIHLLDRKEKRQDRELLERMMKDNEKMTSLIAELIENNEMQTQILSSLSQRVEQLERAFMYERLRRKKKGHAAAGIVCSSGTLPNTMKCLTF